MSRKALFLTYHLPLKDEPGAFRPFMEARLMKMAGYDVTVITSGVQYMTGEDIRKGRGWVEEEDVDGIRVLRTWGVRGHRVSLFKRALNYAAFTFLMALAVVFKAGGADVVFAGTDPIFIMPVVYLASVMKRARLVLDERDLYPETAIAIGVVKEGWLTSLLFSMQEFFRRRSSFLLAATPGIRRKLVEYGHPEGKVSLLYNADVFIDEDLTGHANDDELRKMTGADFIVGYAGGLGIVNDVAVLLRAAYRLKDENGIAFVIVGEGEKRAEYEKWIKERGMVNVHFPGARPRAATRAFIKQMDVCAVALPAGEHFHATLTSKMFDYMAAGKPVLFCGAGDSAESLAKSGGGITAAAGDDESLASLIILLRRDEALRGRLGKANRIWFEENIGVSASVLMMSRALEGALS